MALRVRMIPHSMVLAAALLMATFATAHDAAARDPEMPYSERRALLDGDRAIRMDAPMSKPLWIGPADPAYFKEREFVQSAVDEAPNRVYAVDAGSVTAFEAQRGTVIWRRKLGAGGPLVVLGDALVVTGGDRLVGIDRGSGRIAWVGASDVSFLTTAEGKLFVRDGRGIARLDGAGRTIWRYPARDVRTARLSGTRLLIVDEKSIAALNVAGGSLASRVAMRHLLGTDGRLAIVEDDAIGPEVVGDKTVSLVDLSSGETLVERSLEIGTRTFPQIDDRAAFDRDAVYVSAGDFVYRIALQAPYGAVALPRFGRWVGGPHRGSLYFERYDGLWRVQPRSDRLVAVRLLAYEPRLRQIAALALDGEALEAGFFGGRLFVVDARRPKLLLSAHLPCAAYYGFAASGKTMLALCDVRSKAHLGFVAAFARNWPHS